MDFGEMLLEAIQRHDREEQTKGIMAAVLAIFLSKEKDGGPLTFSFEELAKSPGAIAINRAGDLVTVRYIKEGNEGNRLKLPTHEAPDQQH